MDDPNFHRQITLPTVKSQELTPPPIPSQIGLYQVEALLDKGGMSFLYLGIHPETKDPITIKVLYPEFVSSPEMVQRFLQEAEIIALADHPNIVKLYGHGEWEGGLYIAMEFIQGLSLRQYLVRNPISLKQALDIVMEISMALCHLHGHGIIHRDLKPENILITESGGVKVIDFGIAQLLNEIGPATDQSQKRRLVGTPIYMSPEQKENPSSVSYPSDIYSLGIITYELVLGKLSYGQIHLPVMPKGLQKILNKALQPKLENRYQDIVDFMKDLSDYMASSNFIKDNKEASPLGELLDSLHRSQHMLTPQNPPQWPFCEMDFDVYKNLGISSLYYDFFESFAHTYSITIGEPSIKGLPGIIYSSVVKGMIQALNQLTQQPEEMATVLNSLLLNDVTQKTFAFSHLVLIPEKNILRFISCGCGYLWYLAKDNPTPVLVSSDNPPLGSSLNTQFTETEMSWNIGDTIILYTYSGMKFPSNQNVLFTPEEFQKIVEEHTAASPSKQVNVIIRKVRIHLSRIVNEHSFFVLSLSRN